MQTQTFVFFGQVGSGKGTQVKLLMDFLKNKDSKEQVYISTGSEYRKLIESGNITGSLVKQSIEKGELQPDFLTTSMFTNVLINSLSEDKHLFADGYPRTVFQSQTFEAMMKFYKRDLIKIIYIKVGKEEATKRMLLRARTDDTNEGIAKRFDEYENNVIPAMNYFQNKDGYTIYSINGEQTVEEVHKEIIKALNF
ncbi:MAG TPA: nucleoside monophosphate kinase [Candidatus Paceibacterota bacterium]|nr:nucleoside monophosphate kinase [Candidatus Paceibacterota bacterium]HPT18273.1 nucleoside monophosphate kinase [Candidatus Paceibacterota bacterium]